MHLQAAERLAAECEAAQTRCALLEDRLAEMRVERGQLDTYKQVMLVPTGLTRSCNAQGAGAERTVASTPAHTFRGCVAG